MSHLELHQVSKSFGAVRVIDQVDLKIEPGEFVVFVGPSGSGKSTILRMIAGLETITSGKLLINGMVANDQTPVQRGVAMVFQSYALYPNMTVRQNLAFGLEQQRLPKDEIRAKVQIAAETLKIEALLGRRPSELSGGQSQRVAIGRAIVRDPELFLFDEPLSNLDAELRVHMRVEIKALHARLGRTMIYVTHDQVEAMTMADRIVIFRDGKIEQIGTPLDLYNRPANKFVAGFLGSPQMNFLRVGLDDGEVRAQSRHLRLRVAAQGKPSALIGLRPEHITICPPGDGFLDGRVTLIEQLGGESFVYLVVDGVDETIVVRATGQTHHKTGETIGLSAPDDLIYQFDETSGHCLGSP